MTIKARVKICTTCGSEFKERKGDSNSQWDSREFCSITCKNRSKNSVVSIFERLTRYQIRSDGCWGWSGAKDGKGYGILSNRNGSRFSPEKAHRVSYESEYGEISKGLNVCHKCDNPECTNPQHLFVGSQSDNMKDCSSKGRLNNISFKNLVPGKKNHMGAGVDKNKVIKNG